MNNKKAKKFLSKALDYKNTSEKMICDAVREVARSKGFSEENVLLFDAYFVDGNETIISFNCEGEMCDMSIEMFDRMTKEEFIDWFTFRGELSKETVKLLETEI